MAGERRAKSTLRWVLVVVLVAAAAAGGGWWAGKQVTAPAVSSTPSRAESFVLSEVTSSSVGRSLPLSVTVSQPVRPVARNVLSGVVTSASPGRRGAGDVVYTVSRVPVRVVVGAVPFYRDLVVGIKGDDVTQLERALVAKGLLPEADTTYGPATVAAVKQWQKAAGQAQSGTVPFGQVVAVPALPAQVSLGEAINPGGNLAGGEESVLAPTGERSFELEISEEQTKLIPEGVAINVLFNKLSWPAVVAGTKVNPDTNATVLTLTAPGGGPVCADACTQLPALTKTQLRSQVVVVPNVTGPAVPVAAVQTKADGTAVVLDADGTEQPVKVKASASGVAIIDGVAVGTKIRVPASPAAGSSSGPGAAG